MMWFKTRIVFISLFIPCCLSAQTTLWKNLPIDSLKDLTDIINEIRQKDVRKEMEERNKHHIQIGVFPAIGYTLQTGFAIVVSANAVIYKKHRSAKDSTSLPSTISASISYSQKEQIILPIQATLYFNNNKTILISDYRYLKYPTYTFGLGPNTTPQDSTLLNYKYFKFHQSVLFQVHPHVYIGAGYLLDYFWDVRQVHNQQIPSDFQTYGSESTSFSSGVSLDFMRDTRDNTINAYKGDYINFVLAPRLKILGSDANWTSMMLEYRTYIRFPRSSPNILAIWSYNWLTLGGTPPYLMLPSTGWDKTFNTGRGYIQGRFRSNNMLDAEVEYRIQLTRNGLFGMVVFTNFESFSNINTWQFGIPAPAGGLGLRIKLNKYSRTNIAIDYGWGREGSRGFFVNLGEAF
jgi:outer membrane protein assembly factor BamA